MTNKILMVFMIVALRPLLVADVLPADKHYVKHCTVITNINEYPDVVFLGAISQFNSRSYVYRVSNNDCINDGPRRSTFKAFATSKIHFTAINADKHNAWRDSLMLPADLDIEPGGFYTGDYNPLIEQRDYYRIIGFTPHNMILHLWKSEYSFKHAADSVELFRCTTDTVSIMKEFPL